jgi:hypothetical protein
VPYAWQPEPLAAHVANRYPTLPRTERNTSGKPGHLSPCPRGHIPRRDLPAGDLRKPRRQQALRQSLSQLASFSAIVQCGLQRDLAGGDLSQGLQNLNIDVAPAAGRIIGHAEAPTTWPAGSRTGNPAHALTSGPRWADRRPRPGSAGP